PSTSAQKTRTTKRKNSKRTDAVPEYSVEEYVGRTEESDAESICGAEPCAVPEDMEPHWVQCDGCDKWLHT
ncbi:hypothetical protein PMAYCL1PPCAC_21647, partial [Pristionchus mayeri]